MELDMISNLIQKLMIAVVFLGFIMGTAKAADIEAMVSQDWRVALPAELPDPTQEVAAINQ